MQPALAQDVWSRRLRSDTPPPPGFLWFVYLVFSGFDWGLPSFPLSVAFLS